MSILRSEVQPVSFATYADFLARWQHIHPAERLGGESALTVALQQLRAAPIVGRIWERDVLPLRLDAYGRRDLDLLCQDGELVWVGSGGADRDGAACGSCFEEKGTPTSKERLRT